MVTCDVCETPYPWKDRMVGVDRPFNSPDELVAVMACCPNCGPNMGFETPEKIEEDVDAGKYPGILFVSV